MDPTTSAWILEFLLRQPHLGSWVPHSLISILPVSNSYPRLHKTLLLRSISSDLSRRSICESTLESFESIENLDHAAGLAISDSMQAAYAAAAVECTAKFLKCKPQDHEAFVDAVNRIWKCRVSDMERANCRAGLISKRLVEAKKEMVTAVWNQRVRERLLARDTMEEAMDSVRIYVEEALEEMGPSFLEYVAAEVCGKEVGVRVAGADGGCVGPGCNDMVVVEDYANDVEFDRCEKVDEATRIPSSPKDRHKGSLPLGNRDKSARGAISTGECMLEKPKETGAGVGNKYDHLPTAEVVKVKKALKSSSSNLHRVVEDPLPDALEIAAGILANLTTSTSHKAPEENVSGPDVDAFNPSIEIGVDAKNAGTSSTGNQNGGCPEGTSFPGFMAWNRTARRHEWEEDSIESPSDNSPNCSRGLHLPSPKNQAISPLKKQEINRYSRRRKNKKWNPLEEETLREAVKKHGKGNWKYILNHYREVFKDRTKIDLKDKWRNMTRS